MVVFLFQGSAGKTNLKYCTLLCRPVSMMMIIIGIAVVVTIIIIVITLSILSTLIVFDFVSSFIDSYRVLYIMI